MIVDDGEGKVVGYDYEGYGAGYYDDAKDANGLVEKNHLRYRGYYYDEETGWYYLNNRYYNPRQGRFINCDEVKYIGQDGTNVSYNLYAYCLNNPVNRTDSEGNFGFWAVVGITLAASVMGAAGQIATNIISGFRGRYLMTDVIGATVGSALGAVLSCKGFDLQKSTALSLYAKMCINSFCNELFGFYSYDTEDYYRQFLSDYTYSLAVSAFVQAIVPINKGWFEPKKFLSVYTKPYGQKILLQTALGELMPIAQTAGAFFGNKLYYKINNKSKNIRLKPLFYPIFYGN